MSDPRRPVTKGAVTEMDVLAYADGLLERDPARAREVAAYLEANPGEAARVADYQAQNELIRRCYAPLLGRPTPERLSSMLERRVGSRSRRALARVAGVAALTSAAAATGWLAAERHDDSPPWLEAFVEEALERYALISTDRDGTLAVAPPAEPLADPVAQLGPLALRVPDLAEAGYAVKSRHIFEANGVKAVQVLYAAPDGHELGLFVRPRWAGEPGNVRLLERGGLTLAHWTEGPVAYALAARASAQKLTALTAAIRRGLRHRPAVGTTAIVNGPENSRSEPEPNNTADKPVTAQSPAQSILSSPGKGSSEL